MLLLSFFFFFFNATATTEIYTLSLHDALPIYNKRQSHAAVLELIDSTLEENIDSLMPTSAKG